MCWYIVVDAKLQPPLKDLGIRLVQFFEKEIDPIALNFLPKIKLSKKDIGAYAMTANGVAYLTNIREDIVTAAFMDAIDYEHKRIRFNIGRGS